MPKSRDDDGARARDLPHKTDTVCRSNIVQPVSSSSSVKHNITYASCARNGGPTSGR